MTQVFVDTGGFYAALNRKDQYHREATGLCTRAVAEAWQLCTSNFVVGSVYCCGHKHERSRRDANVILRYKRPGVPLVDSYFLRFEWQDVTG